MFFIITHILICSKMYSFLLMFFFYLSLLFIFSFLFCLFVFFLLMFFLVSLVTCGGNKRVIRIWKEKQGWLLFIFLISNFHFFLLLGGSNVYFVFLIFFSQAFLAYITFHVSLYYFFFLGLTRVLPLLLRILRCDEEFRPT